MMTNEELRDLSYELLDLCYDTEEWNEDTLETAITQITEQIKPLESVYNAWSMCGEFTLFELLRIIAENYSSE